MLTILFKNLIKPFTGLVLVIKLFTGIESDDQAPYIRSLSLVNRADSVIIEVTMKNSVTPEINDLIVHGTEITTTVLFRCDSMEKMWNRTLQYNPIKEYACFTSVNEVCKSTFSLHEINKRFNKLSLYIGTRKEIRLMQKRKAVLVIKVTTDVDVYSLGKTDLWPQEISEEFVIPELP
jgi:hypothetical protein